MFIGAAKRKLKLMTEILPPPGYYVYVIPGFIEKIFWNLYFKLGCVPTFYYGVQADLIVL